MGKNKTAHYSRFFQKRGDKPIHAQSREKNALLASKS